MATIAELLVKIGADSSGLRKELAASQRQLKKAFGAEALGASSAAVGLMGGIAAAMGAVGVASVKMAADMEQNRIAFTTMLGSAQAADSFLKELAAFAEKTPFEFPGLVQSSKKLLAFGFQAQDIIPMMTNIGDAVSAVGGSAEVLDRVTLAFGQMKTKGMVSAEEMKQLAEAGVPAWEMLAKVIGTDIPTAMDMAEKKSISADGAIAGMLSQMGERYGGMMEKQSTTITGIFSNIKDKAGSIMRDMGDEIVKALDLKTKMQGALTWLDEFASKIKDSGIADALYQMVSPEIKYSALAIAGAINMAMIPALLNMGLAAGKAMLPLWPLIAIGAVLGPILGEFAYQLSKAREGLENLPLEDASMQMVDFGNNTDYATKQLDKFLSKVEEHRNMRTEQWFPEVKPTNTGPIVTGGSGKSEAEKEWEKLENKAKQVSDEIQREWVQTTKTQLEQLDVWKAEQEKALDDTKAANENYDRDMERVAATYSTRRTKILQQEAQDALNTFKSIRDGYENIQRDIKTGGLTGSAKDINDINNKYADKAKSAKDFFDKQTQDYETATEAQKKIILSSLDQIGAAYQITEDGKLNLSKATSDAITAYTNQKNKEITDYYASCKDIQANIDAAYAANSMAALQTSLTEQNAIRMNDYTAQQSMMQTWQAAFLAAHSTTAQLVSDIYAGAFSGLKSGISDVLMNVKSISDAWGALGQTIRKVIADYIAQWLAGRIMMAVFGKTTLATETAASVAAGADTAAAWAPAAAMVSLATFGANAGPAMAGIGATTGMAMALSIPMLASGGISTGPTLAMIGDNKYYDEAVIPLNRKTFEKVGLTGADQRPPDQNIITIQAWDGPSVDRWLESGGGTKITKFFKRQARGFAAAEVF